MYTDKFSVNIPPRWGIVGCFALAVLWSVTSAQSINLEDTNIIPIVERSDPSQQCAGYCKQSNKFRLKSGSTYVYDYQALTVSSVTGTSNQTSRLLLTAKAEVHVTSPCEFILQLNDVKLEDSGPADTLVTAVKQEQFRTALQKHHLRFSFQDGVIDQLCPSADEQVWALNIKRGILSNLQNSMKVIDSVYTHTYEVDVSGTCETIYRSRPEMINNHLVEKNKNLMQCIGRGKQSLVLPGVFSTDDQTKSAPLVRSEQTCYQNIHADGYMSKSTCVEVHLFTPFSNRDSGISTKVEQTLQINNILLNSPSPKLDKYVDFRTNLKFDYSSENTYESSEDELVAITLEKLSKNTESGVSKDIPQLFALLIDQLKGFSYYQLSKVFAERKDQKSHKFLLDAMPLLGTVDSVLVMQDLFTAGDLSQDDIDAWLTSLLFYKKPTLQLLDAVKYFLADRRNSKSMLTISSMIHSYCTLDRDCANKYEVIEVMNKIQSGLGDSCRTKTKEEKERMIVILKAVGNAGIYTKSLDTLSSCYKNALNPMEVRLAAVSAFRRFSCQDVSKSSIIDLFYDQKQDVELRIAGYLAAMQCPTAEIVEKVIDMLYSDETFHVKSFVWTHLTNLKETSSQWRRDIFHILQEYELPENMTTDARFYSRNYENSVFNDNLDVGATIDSNVIFSTQSYLPRSATLNLTVDIFGEAINLFEIGTRLEGFEDVIENVFSKTGIFPEESLRTMLRSMRNASSNSEITSDVKKHSDNFKSQQSFLGKPPRGSMFARIFGHELYLKQFYGLNELVKENSFFDKQLFFNTKNMFNGKDVDYTNSLVFLDSNYVIPTAIGLPLSININGTTTVGLKLKAEADLRKLQKTKSGKIEFSINPSAAVQIIGTMTLDAKVASSGVKSISTLNTNTYMDIKLSIENGTIDTYINLPRDQMEIFDVSSNLFVIHHNTLEEIKGIEDNVDEWDTCSGQRVPTISGLRLCSQLTLHNASQHESAPYFPLSGSFKYAVLLQKSDTFTTYHFQLVQDVVLSRGGLGTEVNVLFETPGSTISRTIKAKLLMGPNDALISLDSPVGSIELNGKYQKSSLELQAIVNKKSMFNLLLSLQNRGYGRYDPLIWLYINGYTNTTISGRVDIISGSKYSSDLKITGLTKDPISFSGHLNGKEGGYNLILHAQAPYTDLKLRGDLRFSKTSISTKALIVYALNNHPPQSIDFTLKLHSNKKGSLQKYGLVTSFQSNKFSAYNTRFSWMLYQSDSYFDCITDIKVGKTEWNSQQMYHNYKLANGDIDFAIKFTLASPPKDLDYRIESQFINSQSRTFVFGLAQLNEKQRFITNFDVITKAYNDTSLSIEIANPWKGVYFNARLEPKSQDNEFFFNVTTGLTEKQQIYRELYFWSVIQCYQGQNFHIRGELHNLNVWKEPLLIDGALQYVQQDGGAFKSQLQIYWPGSDNFRVILSFNENFFDIIVRYYTLSGQFYGGNLSYKNTEQVLKFLISLDLENKLLFSIESSEKNRIHLSELKLYWNEKQDKTQSLIMSYKNIEDIQQKAYIMMPGHYAAFDVKHLKEGLSSVNLTAIWGVSKDSATNAIMLSTAWHLSETDLTSTAILTTPFIGFEKQAVDLKIIFSEDQNKLITELQWQDQKVEIHLSWQVAESSVYGLLHVNGTIEALKNITLCIDLQRNGNSSPSDILYSYNSKIEASYNSIETTKLQVMILSKDNEKDLNVLLTSPFQDYENILLKITKKGKEFKFVQSWAKDKTITLDYSYNLPYRANINFTSPFDKYNLGSLEYSVDYSAPISLIVVKAVLNEKYATCKVKSFQTREVDQKGKLVTQIISTEIETEGNYLIQSFVANFTHKVDRNQINTRFITLNNELVVMDFNLTSEYTDQLLKAITLNILSQNHYINGKFIHSVDTSVHKYSFEGKWNKKDLKMVLLSNYNPPIVYLGFVASASFWQDDLKIILSNRNEPNRQDLELEIKLPSSGRENDQNSQSVLKFNYSKLGTDIINAKLLFMSPVMDTFKAEYKYSTLTENSYTQKIEINFLKDKRIVADSTIIAKEDQQFAYLLVQTPFYTDIQLSANHTIKDSENVRNILVKAILGDKTYSVTGEIFRTNMAAKALLSFNSSDDKLIETGLSYNFINQEWSSEVFISYFGNVTKFKMFVDCVKEGEISTEIPVEEWKLSTVFSKILFEPKTVRLSISHIQDSIEMELIDKRGVGNFSGSLAINANFKDVTNHYMSILHCTSLSRDYLLFFTHKKNYETVFTVNTKTTFDSTSLSSLTDVETPFENWENLKFGIHYGITDNSRQVKGVFEKSKMKYEINGKINRTTDILAADMQFKSHDTNLTLYSKYNTNTSNNHNLYVYAVYNEETLQGLMSIKKYKSDETLKQGWQLESDFSRNGKHYKIDSFFYLEIIPSDDSTIQTSFSDIYSDFPTNEEPFSWIDYHKRMYFNFQLDDLPPFINYDLRINNLYNTGNSSSFLVASISLADFELNLNATIYDKTHTIVLTSDLVNFKSEFDQKGSSLSLSLENYYSSCNITFLGSGNKTYINFNSNINSWENLNSTAEFGRNEFILSVVRNGKDDAQLFLSKCPGFKCAGGNVTLSFPGLFFSTGATYDIRKYYESKLEYNLNGKSNKFSANVKFDKNNTNFTVVTPLKGYEDIRLSCTNNGIGTVVILEQNNRKALSASVKKLDDNTSLAISSFIGTTEYINIRLNYTGILDKKNKDKIISILILKKGMKLFDFSFAMFLEPSKKIGLETHLHSTAIKSTFNNIKFVASLEFRESKKAILYIQVNQPLIDFTGSIEGSIKNGKILLRTPLGFTRYEITGIEIQSNFINIKKSLFFLLKRRNRLPNSISANLSKGNILTEVNILLNTDNEFDINKCSFHALYNNSGRFVLTSIDFNSNNYLDLKLFVDSPLKTNFSVKISQPNLISVKPILQFDLNYNMVDLQKNMEFYVMYKEVMYKFSGYLEWLDTFLDAKVYFDTNGVQYIFPTFKSRFYNTNAEIQYNFNNNFKFVNLYYNSNNNTEYKLNMASLHPKHLEFIVRFVQNSSTPYLDYINLKYNFVNETTFNVKTKYQEHNVLIDCALDSSNGTIFFSHQDEGMLDKFEVMYDHSEEVKISFFGMLKGSKKVQFQIIKSDTEREIMLNLFNIWAPNLLNFHIQNCLHSEQNFKWNVSLLNESYSSSGDIQGSLDLKYLRKWHVLNFFFFTELSKTLDVYETQNLFQINSNLSLKTTNYRFECFLAKDSKFIFKVLEPNNLFAFEADLKCDKHSKRFCEERHNYINIIGLTEEIISINYDQILTNIKKSVELTYDVKGSKSSISIQLPIKTTDHFEVEWKNRVLSQIYVLFNLFNHPIFGIQTNLKVHLSEENQMVFEKKLINTKLTILLQNEPYILEINHTEVKFSIGKEQICIHYSALLNNKFTFSFNSTFGHLNYLNLQYNKNYKNKEILANIYSISDKHGFKWKGEAYYEGINHNFNVTFTNIEKEFTLTCKKIVKTGNISSLFLIEQNGIVKGSGTLMHLQDGFKSETNVMINYENYVVQLDFESSNDKTFYNLLMKSNSPYAEYYSQTELNFKTTYCGLNQVNYVKYENPIKEIQRGEITWKLFQYTDHNKTAFKTNYPDQLKEAYLDYVMFNTSVIVKSPWFNLEETGLVFGQDLQLNSATVKLFSGSELVHIVYDLIYVNESVFYYFELNIPDVGYQAELFSGQTYLIGFYDDTKNELTFEFKSPLINHEHVLFRASLNNKTDVSKEYTLILQLRNDDLIQLTAVTTTTYNFNISGHFLDLFVIDCVLQKVNNNFISRVEFILNDQKFINMAINLDQKGDGWNALLTVDKFLKLSNLTVQVENIINEFKLNIKHKLFNTELRMDKIDSKINSLLTINSNIINQFNLDFVTLINLDQTINVDISVLYNSSRNGKVVRIREFKLGGALTKENGIHNANIYINNNKITGQIYNKESKINCSLEYSLPDMSLNGSFYFNSKIAPIFEVIISNNFLGKTRLLSLKVNKQTNSLKYQAEIKIDDKSYLVEFNIILNSTPMVIELNYIDDKLQKYQSSLKVTNDEELFILVGSIKDPKTNELNLEMMYNRRNKELKIKSDDIFVLESRIQQNNSNFFLKTTKVEYKIEYKIKEFKYFLNISSPYASLEVSFENVEGMVIVSSTSNYIGVIFQTRGNIMYNENHKQVLLQVENGEDIVILIESVLNIENGFIELIGKCNTVQSINELNFIHNLSFPRDTHLSITSPLLSNGIIEAGITSKDASMLFLLRLGKTHLKLGASFDPEDGVKINIQAPIFSQMDTATINGVFLKEIDDDTNELNRYKISASVAFTSDNVLLSQASIKFEYEDLSHLEMMAIMKTKSKKIDDIEMFIHIPLRLSLHNNTAYVSLILPKVQPVLIYFVSNNYHCNATLKLFGHTLVESIVDYHPLRSSLTWNLKMLKHYLLLSIVKLQDDHILSVSYNNKKLFTVTNGFNNEKEWKRYTWEIETTIKGHDKYGIKLETKNSEHKKFMILLSMPLIGSDVGFDLEYFFNNITFNIITAKFHLPHFVPGNQSYGFSFSNNINVDEHKIKVDYYVHIGKFLGSCFLLLQANSDNLILKGKGQLNDKTMLFDLNTDIDPSQVQLHLDIETPFSLVSDCKFGIVMNRLLVGSEAQLSYNARTIAAFKISEGENQLKYLKLESIWKSVSFGYLYDAGTSLSLYNSLCWDLNNINTPEGCIELTLKSENQLNHYLKAKFVSGSKVIELECGCTHLVDDTEYFSYLSWGNNHTFGFKLLREYSGDNVEEYLKYHLLQIVLPERTFEGSTVVLKTVDLHKANIKIKWDADNNSDKNIGVEYVTEFDDDVLVNTLTFQHFALEHDLIISSLSNDNELKLIVEYSPVENEIFTTGIGYWAVNDVAGAKIFVEHKASNTYIQMLTNNTFTTNEITGHIAITYINSTLNTIKYVDVHGGFDFGKKLVFVDLSSNGNKFVASGKYWNKENNFSGITIETGLNQKEPIRLEVGLNTKQLEIEIELNHGLSNTLVMYCGMPSNKEITGKILHTLNGYQNSDALATLKLNTTKLLWGRFEFNKGVFADLHNTVFVEYTDMGLIISELLKGFVDFYQVEMTDGFLSFGKVLSDKVNIVLISTNSEIQQVYSYFTNFGDKFNTMYRANQFYMKDLHHAWMSTLSYSTDKLNYGMSTLVNILDSALQAMKQVLLQVLKHFNIKLSNVVALLPDFKVLKQNLTNQTTDFFMNIKTIKKNINDNIKHLIKQTCETLKTIRKEIGITLTIIEMEINNFVTRIHYLIQTHVYNLIVEWIDVVDAGATTLLHVTSDMADIIIEGVMSTKEIRQFISICNDVQIWLDHVLDVNYLFSVAHGFINDTVELVQTDINKNFNELQKVLFSVAAKWNEFIEQPVIQHVINRVNEIYQKAVWLWNASGISHEQSTFWRAIFHITAKDVTTGIMVPEPEEDLYSPKYVFDTSRNSFEFYQRLPFEWRGFNELPNVTGITSGIEKYVQNEDESSPNTSFLKIIEDWIHEVSEDTTADDNLFGQTRYVSAMIAGNNIITFDGKSYVFAGACSYYLAGDLMMDSFSIIINYEMKDGIVKKKSLTILNSNSSVELGWDYSVSVDGNKNELPVEIGSATVIQRRVHEIRVHSLHGYTIECNFEVDICTFTLSSTNFGKTGGLLGTYNNHNFDDLTSPEGKVLEINEFVNSWVVGDSEEFDQCGIVEYLNNEFNEEDVELKHYKNDCDQMFISPESQFSKCFNSVDPRLFYQMCRSNLDFKEEDKDHAMFLTISTYIKKCLNEGITLPWPTKYSKCLGLDDSGEFVTSAIGSAAIIPEISRSADVVFVVEEANCTTVSNLGIIVNKLESALKSNKLSDNHYAVVSFNGEILGTPHIKTINGEIWTEKAKDINQILTSKSIRSKNISDSKTTSTYEALEFASSLPFRIGVTKTIILVSCGNCADKEYYTELMNIFLKKEIKLHILQNNAITGFNGKAKAVFGADINGAYTRRNVKSLSPSLPLMKKVLLPKDLCTPVALETNGTIFNLDLNKKVLDVWSRVVAKSLEPNNCQIVHCVQQPDGLGQFVSESCSYVGISPPNILQEFNRGALKDYSEFDSADYIDLRY